MSPRHVLFVAALLATLAAPAFAQNVKGLKEEADRLEARLRELKEASGAIESRFATESPLEIRVYPIRDLVSPLRDFIAPSLDILPAGSEFDEDAPPFGTSREGERFFDDGDLVDLVRALAPSVVWDGDGAVDVTSRALVVTAPPKVQARTRELLADLRAGVGRLVTVEIRAVRARSLPRGALSADETEKLLAALEASDEDSILASVEVTGHVGQRLAVFDGSQTAFVQDYDVEVAQKAKIQDPIVGIAQHGLAADVRVLAHGDGGRLLVHVRTDVARLRPDRGPRQTSVGPVGRPERTLLQVEATVDLPDGGAIVLGGSTAADATGARTAILVRARTYRPPFARLEHEDEEAELRDAIASLRRRVNGREEAATAGGPAFRTRLHPVGDLVFAPPDRAGPALDLTPSGGTSFSEEDLDVDPLFDVDGLGELIRHNVARGSWEELASAKLSASRGTLVVAHTAGAHADLAALLHDLRRHAFQTVEVDVDVLRIGDADRRALRAASDGAPVLSADARARLARWIDEGRVRRIHEGRIVAQSGQRTALVDRSTDTYVYDIDVELAEDSLTPDPLVASVPEGLVVDVRPVAVGGGAHVSLEARIQRARLVRPIPDFETPVGTIQTPTIRMSKVSGTFLVPNGATIVLGGSVETSAPGESEGCLVLLTPRVISGR